MVAVVEAVELREQQPERKRDERPGADVGRGDDGEHEADRDDRERVCKREELAAQRIGLEMAPVSRSAELARWRASGAALVSVTWTRA